MKHHQRHLRTTAGFLMIAGLVLGAGSVARYPTALAGDDKIFAPQFCVPLEPETHELGNADFQIDSVERTFVTGHEQQFVCPLMRDIIAGELDTVWIRVYNAIAEENESRPDCCVYSLSPLATDVDAVCDLADEAEGRQSLQLDLDDFAEYNNGYYVVSCWMGVGDRIYGIRTSESD